MKTSIGANTLAYPAPAFVVGTYDAQGQPNVMTAAWGGICCSRPPCVAVSLRKATYSYHNIVAREAFTISIASERYVKEVDYFGIASGRDADKFARTGLTPARSDVVDAPYVAEFPFVIECGLLHTIEIGLHTQFVGEVIDIKVEEDVLGPDGQPDVERIRPLVYATGNRAYYALGGLLGRAFSAGREVG